MLRLGTNTPLAFRTVFWRTAMVSDTRCKRWYGLVFDRIYRINRIEGRREEREEHGNHAEDAEEL